MKKHPACNRCIRISKRALIFALLLSVVIAPQAVHAFDLLLGTGEAGSFSHFTGRLLCRIVNRYADGIACKALPTSDEVYNLTNLQGGSLDIILIDSLTLHDAIQKQGAFAFLDISYDNLRVLFPVYDEPFALVVRQDAHITGLNDLTGKRINAGAPRSPQHLATDALMQAKNWTPKRFSLFGELAASLSQDTMAFCHGNIQAMLFVGVHPDSSLQQLFKLCEATLINLDDQDIQNFVRSHPAFLQTRIPAETYPSQKQAVTTFGTRMLLVCSQDLDLETAYTLIQTIDRHRQDVQSAHPALASFAPKAALQLGIDLQRHPGAVKYLAEQ